MVVAIRQPSGLNDVLHSVIVNTSEGGWVLVGVVAAGVGDGEGEGDILGDGVGDGEGDAEAVELSVVALLLEEF